MWVLGWVHSCHDPADTAQFMTSAISFSLPCCVYQWPRWDGNRRAARALARGVSCPPGTGDKASAALSFQQPCSYVPCVWPFRTGVGWQSRVGSHQMPAEVQPSGLYDIANCLRLNCGASVSTTPLPRREASLSATQLRLQRTPLPSRDRPNIKDKEPNGRHGCVYVPLGA